MSARDEFVNLARFAKGVSGRDAKLRARRIEAARALDEIDRLRAETADLHLDLVEERSELAAARDEIDQLRHEMEGLHYVLDEAYEARCTPAERELIDAAFAEVDEFPLTVMPRLRAAADAVLAERGQA